VFTVYAVCLQKTVHKTEVSLFSLSNQKPEGNTAGAFRLQHCRKKIVVNITDGSSKKQFTLTYF
jgi:hypothetical protein